MADPDLFAVVMAGGSGTRFWPASRAARPKQYLPISGGGPMLAETVRRLEGLVPLERVLVVTSAPQIERVRECLPELPAENLLAEPEARNTAPCVAWAAAEVAQRSARAVQVVLPADHVIEPVAAFRRTLAAAARDASGEDALYTLGVEPSHPATGYGYIEAAEELRRVDGTAVYRVASFKEKPDEATARGFLERGGFYWNAGIFVWRTDAILDAVRRHAPELARGLDRLAAGEDLARVYAELPKQPVDVAILEPAAAEGRVRMLPVDYAWNDVGSWAALTEVHAADADGHWRVLADDARLLAHDSARCLAYAEEEELIALVGVEDLVVVRAGKATLVCHRDRAQEVKAITERLAGEAPDYR